MGGLRVYILFWDKSCACFLLFKCYFSCSLFLGINAAFWAFWCLGVIVLSQHFGVFFFFVFLWGRSLVGFCCDVVQFLSRILSCFSSDGWEKRGGGA